MRRIFTRRAVRLSKSDLVLERHLLDSSPLLKRSWPLSKVFADDHSQIHPSLSSTGWRMGRAQGIERAPDRAARSDKGRHDAEPDESAGRIRLSRLRLARSEAHVVVRILRERRQGGRVGSDGQALYAGVLRRALRHG